MIRDKSRYLIFAWRLSVSPAARARRIAGRSLSFLAWWVEGYCTHYVIYAALAAAWGMEL